MACARIEQPGWPDVVVVGAVLPSHGIMGGDVVFMASLQPQVAEWSLLWGNPRCRVLCVVGDLNRPLDGRLQGFSSDSQAALAAALTNLNLICTTTHLPAQGNDGYCAVDHICFGWGGSPLVLGDAVRFLGTGLSDHDGYYVDVDLPVA